MIRAVLFGVVLAAPAFADSGPVEPMQACLRKTDDATRAARATPVEDQIAQLSVWSTMDSSCVTDAVAACSFIFGEQSCFVTMLEYLSVQSRTLARQMPDQAEGSALMQANYAAWLEPARAPFKPIGRAHCELPPELSDTACSAIAAGTDYIAARHWRRTLDLVDIANR